MKKQTRTEGLKGLEWLSKNHEPKNKAGSLPYIQDFFKTLVNFEKEGPCFSFISALYDGLSNSNKWVSLSKEQYSKILVIVKSLDEKATYKEIDNYINELEKMGIDTTPY